MTNGSLGRTLLAFALLHSVHQGQICLLLQVFLDIHFLQWVTSKYLKINILDLSSWRTGKNLFLFLISECTMSSTVPDSNKIFSKCMLTDLDHTCYHITVARKYETSCQKSQNLLVKKI